MEKPSRRDALKLLHKYNKNISLLNHALAVEAVMRHFAKLKNQNEEDWGIIGLIHDLDYEMYPELHCKKAAEILETENWPTEFIRAVISHGWGICSDVEPLTDLEKTLYTIDELTGLVAAAALVRPSKSVMDLSVQSVIKKWKQKGFAAGANREIIIKGAEMLQMDINFLVEHTIKGMQSVSEKIGL